ncbi:hypothetical protein TU70_16090, partial [Bacillus mycoides]
MGLANSLFPSSNVMEDASQHFKSVQSRKEPKPMGLANSLFPSSNAMEDASQHFKSVQSRK